MATCSQLDLLSTIAESNPSLSALIALLNEPDRTQLCSEDEAG
jgi:hypothetical protein